jgi:Ca2+-binding EF-hand superfamily protein
MEARRKQFERQEEDLLKLEKEMVRTKDFNSYTTHNNVKRNTEHADLITPEEVARLKEVFSLFDENEDGKMPMAEFCKVMRVLRHDPTQRELEFFEVNGDEIDFCHAQHFYKMVRDREPDEQALPTSGIEIARRMIAKSMDED